MGKLKPLVEKEVKDLLRDPRIYIGLIVPIIMLPLMGFAISAATQSAQEVGLKSLKLALLDYDGTQTSAGFKTLLTNMGLNVSSVVADNIPDALDEAKAAGSKVLLVLPQGFEDNLTAFKKAGVSVYSVVDSMGLGSIGAYSVIDGVLEKSSEILSAELISELDPNADPDTIRTPLNITRYSIVKDVVMQVPPQALFNQLFLGYGIMVPMVLLILAMTVTQIAATATAVENEEKTLETLLTFPVNRYDILVSKLLGSSVVAILGGIMFTGGFFLYFEGAFSMANLGLDVGTALPSLPPPPPVAYVVLAVSLMLAILFVTSLGIVIGALSSDVRMAGSLIGVVIVPVLVPSLLIMYGDMGALPLAFQILVYALPTSYPMIMAKEMVMATIPVEVLYGIPYSAALTLIALYTTSMLLAPEKLLTLQYKLRLRRMKKKKVGELQ